MKFQMTHDGVQWVVTDQDNNFVRTFTTSSEAAAWIVHLNSLKRNQATGAPPTYDSLAKQRDYCHDAWREAQQETCAGEGE
jgi:hypothetical protein